MDLEQFIAEQNGMAFWREFTFTQLKFRVPQGELELADNVVWFDNVAFVTQMKEREVPTSDPDEERKWFENKVMKSAVKQISDSLRYLDTHGSIPVSNIRGTELEISGAALREIHRVVIYKPALSLPSDCTATHFKESRSAGFVHIFNDAAYARVLQTLIAPEEIRRYFEYRQTSLSELAQMKIPVVEDDILAAYASEEPVPSPASHKKLERLLMEVEHYDLSSILRRLADHIEAPRRGSDHSRIMVEFAKLPRSAWRAAKERFDAALAAARGGDSVRPYRFYFPASGCSFMFAPLHPYALNDDDPIESRKRYLQTLTEVAKYMAKADRAVGVQISFMDEHFMIDWCLTIEPWVFDAQMEDALARSPFRPVREQKIDGFHFLDTRGDD
ncbi:hypothetical protein [Mesorhizobium sp. L48C026A00]|uniref:hypothetical protein n=1 Tax=Mesorhizobium sp. L48C026A00 TaxID=1287182 RepID=UPI0003D016CC|nr:hypothetical protein [Mesorhizobium sp. L48C026A00]ESZ02460.1 hypothetical protein X737_38285 [Mesorhizobium sp. L48C026A00]